MIAWRSYVKAALNEAGSEAIRIIREQAPWDGLVIVTGAIIALLVGGPVGQPTAAIAGAFAALALVILVVGVWCLAWAPVNLHRSLLTENHALQASITSLQVELNSEKDTVSIAIRELSNSGHLATFRRWGKEFIQGTYPLYSGFNNDGIKDLLMMHLIKAERIPVAPKPLEPLPPGAFRTSFTDPPFRTLYTFTELSEEVWKVLQQEEPLKVLEEDS
ncbi:MAG TPA: hypothetical protein VMR52_05725 [Dehalococcoidia bacterium]|nr:hypothetical protein [Dehalococcoidia bacterium]